MIEISPTARFVHARAADARTDVNRLARSTGTDEARAVAQREHSMLDALEEVAVEHGRARDGRCPECSQTVPCVTLRRVATIWHDHEGFNTAWWINNHQP